MTTAEGWYRDPYGAHEDRWFSDGHPTSLVRDAGAESRDEPPGGEPPRPPEPVPEEAGDASDTKRADDVNRKAPAYDLRRARLAALLGSLPTWWPVESGEDPLGPDSARPG
jgi:hypothetical protein